VFAPPSIPALTAKGFVQWQTIQILLEPQTQVPVLQYAVANWGLKHPDTGVLFPADLPKDAFPSETDPDTERWHQECQERSLKASEEARTETPRWEARPDFADFKSHWSHIRVTPTSPRDFFRSNPANFAYVHISPPRHTSMRSPERERAREKERFIRRQASDDPTLHRRSFSDYPTSPDGPRRARPAHLAPQPSSQRRRHSHPRHYSSNSDSDSDSSSISPKTPKSSSRRSPLAIPIRRYVSGTSEESPRIIRTAVPPSPPTGSHVHSARSEPARSSRDDDNKRRSTFIPSITSSHINQLREAFVSIISPALGDIVDRPRSSSNGSRGKRDHISSSAPGSAKMSKEDILPNSKLSKSWSDIDSDYSDFDSDKAVHGGDSSKRARSRERGRSREVDRSRSDRRDREKDRSERGKERERERERSTRERERGLEHERSRGRTRVNHRDRDRDHNPSRTRSPTISDFSSDSEHEHDRGRRRDRERDRHRHSKDRDRDRDRDALRERDCGRDRDRDRIHTHTHTHIPSATPSPVTLSPAATAASSALHGDRDHESRRRAAARPSSDDDTQHLSPRGWPSESTSTGRSSNRRAGSHADAERRREWDRDRDRERERVRERERDREWDWDRDRDRERLIREDRDAGGGMSSGSGSSDRRRRGGAGDDRTLRDRDAPGPSPKPSHSPGGMRERMPSPVVGVMAGVGGRKYPDIQWSGRD